jgi:hypothetical protein
MTEPGQPCVEISGTALPCGDFTRMRGLADDDGRPDRTGYRSLGRREQRLAFLNDIRGQFRRAAAAGILTAWITPAGTVRASLALNVFGVWPSI